MNNKLSITSPVGRIVEGSLYKAFDKDFDGKPLTVKTGPNAGQPRVQYFFSLAIEKKGEDHWAKTEWGQQILNVGAAAFPGAYQRPDFAWKIIDGDSQVPNKRNTKPADKEGHRGHWIIRLSSGFAPKVVRLENGIYMDEKTVDYVKPGYFVQASFKVEGNGNQNNPGVYLNIEYVCFRAYGDEISFGPNVNDAGFGAAPLPAGASATPLAGSAPLPALPGGAALPTQGQAGLPGIPVLPNPGFLQVPAPAAAIPSAPASATTTTSPFRTMTAKAGANTYDQFIAGGWTEANLIAHDYMTVS